MPTHQQIVPSRQHSTPPLAWIPQHLQSRCPAAPVRGRAEYARTLRAARAQGVQASQSVAVPHPSRQSHALDQTCERLRWAPPDREHQSVRQRRDAPECVDSALGQSCLHLQRAYHQRCCAPGPMLRRRMFAPSRCVGWCRQYDVPSPTSTHVACPIHRGRRNQL